MRQVYKVVDGIVDFSDSVLVDDGQEIPEGYEYIDPESMQGKYKDDGTQLTDEELEAIRQTSPPVDPVAVLGKQLAQLKLDMMRMQGGQAL